MKRLLTLGIGLWISLIAFAQFIPAFVPGKSDSLQTADKYWHKKNTLRHLEASLTLGTTGVGIDIAAPLTPFLQVRVGYDYMPRFRHSATLALVSDLKAQPGTDPEGAFAKINEFITEKTGAGIDNTLKLKGKLTIGNFKFLVDVYPFKYNKNWHFTAGVYYGGSQIAEATYAKEGDANLQKVLFYNQLYEKAVEGDAIKGYGRLVVDLGTYVNDITEGPMTLRKKGDPYLIDPAPINSKVVQVRSNALKPYVGFGYGGRLIPNWDSVKITVECGAMIWGGSPKVEMYDGTNLGKDVTGLPKSINNLIKVTDKLVVYPVLSVRIAKTLF